MKKFLYSVLFLFVVLIACSKEEEATPPPTPKFTVSISASEGGSVSTEGGSYDQGTKVTVTATPDGEFLFDRWSDGNTDNPREITVTSSLSLTANFVKKKYALTVNIEGEGTVQEEVIVQGSTSTTEYNSGTSVRLTATPSDEWVFSGWSGSVESTDNPIEVSVDEAKEITATFKLKQYDLTINIEGEGTVSETIVTQPTLYDSGTVVKLEANPSDEWVFSGWSGSVESTDNPIEVSVDEAKEITATFKLKQYDLTINIEGEGTVSETIVTQPTLYDSGTVVKLEATPSEGWEFVGWSGDLESTENPIEITLSQDNLLSVIFKESVATVSFNDIPITYSNTDIINVSGSLDYRGVSSTFHYSDQTGDYIYVPGLVSMYEAGNPLNSLEVEPVPATVFKFQGDKWELYEVDYDLLSWNIRNVDKLGSEIAIVDGNEIGANPSDWKGHAWYGRVNNGKITWNRVNTIEEMGYFHGVTIGDINNDGLTDIGTAPGYHFFAQDPSGNFEKLENDRQNSEIFHLQLDDFNDPKPESCVFCGTPFEFQITDLDNDGINEIIVANYQNEIGSTNWSYDIDSICGIGFTLQVFKYNTQKDIYEVYWRYNENNDVFPRIQSGPTSMKVADINNDGLKDVLIAREGDLGGTIDVWLGNYDLSFTPYFLHSTNPQGNAVREFIISDVNHDNYLDIIWRSNGSGGDQSSGGFDYYIDVSNKENGIKLNSLILLNDGTGRFYEYNEKPLKIYNVYPQRVQPYMRDGKLNFWGIYLNDEANRDFEQNEQFNYSSNTLIPRVWNIQLEVFD